MIAQGAHASMKVLLDHQHIPEEDWAARRHWLSESFTKICVRADSEEDLLEIHAKAMLAGLHTAVIVDAGRTEFHGVPTTTCIAIGPEYPEDLVGITDELKLL